MDIFSFADILLPREELMEKWAVIACDQFSSQPEYWRQTAEIAGDAPSALRLILPEAELGPDPSAQIRRIDETMLEYLQRGIFREYRDAFLYVERRLRNGMLRRGVVGKLDLERYDYGEKASTPVRATEKTVVERIPPRVKIRENAALELPHVLLLCDDERRAVIEALAREKETLPKLYDFELMEGGGRIEGRLVQGAAAESLRRRLEEYEEETRRRLEGTGSEPVLYAVGDGNHSLATAKACWEQRKARGADPESDPARFALVELENLRDECQQFTPIHRILRQTDPEALLRDAEAEICAPGGRALPWIAGTREGVLYLDPGKGASPVGILQDFLDRWLQSHPGQIDYIHGDGALRAMAAEEGAVGFLLPAMDKAQLFRVISAGGVLPRKTFSMGHATEKRYYVEARKIR